MKKRLLAAVLALCMVLSGAALAAEGSADPLISLSYLNGTYWTVLSGLVRSAVDEATKPSYDAAVDKAQQQAVGQESPAPGFTAQTGSAGGTVTLGAGSGLLWTAGGGTVRSGVLVDVTAGRETVSGGALAVGHRYLAAEETTVAFTTPAVCWMAEGEWSATAGDALPYADVTADMWYYDAVRYVTDWGLFNGVTDTEFQPLGAMTRGMVTTVLYRLAGKPAVSYAQLFTDVPASEWYAPGVIWAGQAGVVSGYGDGTFLPLESVSRQQIAVILYQYAKYAGADVAAWASLSGFADGAGVAAWARNAMSWAVAEGLMNGNGGLLRPYDSATRAEVAAMFQRFQVWLEEQ